MKFSQRKGINPVSEVIQIDGMSQELRNSLWNVLTMHFWGDWNFRIAHVGQKSPLEKFAANLWFYHLDYLIESIPSQSDNIVNSIRSYFFQCQWFEVYEFLEFTLRYFDNEEVNEDINFALERKLSGYRYVGGVMADITDHQEIKMLEEAVKDDNFSGVQKHLKRALEHLSNRDNPDYRNSIKESISAVESIAKIISDTPKATLADALKILGSKNQLHPSLKDSFLKLYGYTSDEGGIRHAMLDEPSLNAADAKFFLLSCTSFINYLKTKM